ncbi:hypothetical protein Pelo_19037 [Pelomyxa schiedti]|nr:hypothetical protein Pelo_19037 [Pelomyxa schiedti]
MYADGPLTCALTSSVATLDAWLQLLAFASASHPRCGATSAARSLWLHGPSAAAAVRDACCVRGGTSARCDSSGCGSQMFCLVVRYRLVTFGISPVLLGVTHGPAVSEWGTGLKFTLVGCDRALTCCLAVGWDLVLCGTGAHNWDYGTAKVIMKRTELESPGQRWISNNERWMIREPHFIWSKYILDEVVLIVPEAAAEGSKMLVAVDVLRTFTETRLCVMSVTSLPIGNVWNNMYGETLHMKGEGGVECVVVDNSFSAEPGVVHVALPGGKLMYLTRGTCGLSQLNRHQFCIQSYPGGSPLFEVWDCNNVTAPLSSIETSKLTRVVGGSGFLFSTTKGTLTVTEASSGFLVLTLSLSVSQIVIHSSYL